MQSQTGLVGSITEILTRRTRRLQPADGSRNHGHSLVRVFDHLAEGLTNREIGARLGLSQHTIKNYLLKIFDKLVFRIASNSSPLRSRRPSLVTLSPRVKIEDAKM